MLTLRNLSRFRKLTALERGFLVRALLLLPAIGLGLRMVGFGKVQTMLNTFGAVDGREPAPDAALKTALAAARMVSMAARRGFYRANCLPTSLALAHFLRRQGIAVDLRVGVRKVAGALEAHAWVEYQGYQGQPLNDDMDVHERFPAFVQPIRPRQRTLD